MHASRRGGSSTRRRRAHAVGAGCAASALLGISGARTSGGRAAPPLLPPRTAPHCSATLGWVSHDVKLTNSKSTLQASNHYASRPLRTSGRGEGGMAGDSNVFFSFKNQWMEMRARASSLWKTLPWKLSTHGPHVVLNTHGHTPVNNAHACALVTRLGKQNIRPWPGPTAASFQTTRV